MSFHYKRRRRTEDQGVDDWLMTYADLITLLLCFFAIFLSVSIPKEEQFEQARQKVMEQFANPDVVEGQFPKPIKSEAPKSNNPFDAMPSIIDMHEGMKNMDIHQGDRITTIDMNSAPLFKLGAAELSSDGTNMLNSVLQLVQSEKYRDYTVTVEGHTDDNPISTPQFPSNWELSTARAAAVVRYMIGNGVKSDRLRASGFADISPKVPNRDKFGRPIPENQAQNRRVVVKLERVEPGDPE
jgi:chemotaxis protein MotB